MMYRSVFVLFFLLCGGECQNVQFQTDGTTELCIGQSVEYQCTSSGSGVQVLIWRIYHNDGTQFGSDVQYTSLGNPATNTIGMFTVKQLTMANQIPLISNISFTVQSSINGYTIDCVGVMNNQNFTIPIPDPISPDNVTVDPNTFTKSSVNISWTESSFSQSMCFSGYRYNVTSDTPDWNNIIMESTSDTSVMVTDLVPSDDQYCVVVSTYDTGNRNSSGSDPACLLFNVPQTPVISSITNVTNPDGNKDITVNWTVNNAAPSGVAIPPILSYTVTIFNTFNDSDDEVFDNMDNLPPSTTSLTFTGVPRIDNYTIEVIVFNVVGNSSAMRFFPDPVLDTPVIPSSTTTLAAVGPSQSSVSTPSVSSMPSVPQSPMSTDSAMSIIGTSSTPGGTTTDPTNPSTAASTDNTTVIAVVVVVVIVVVLIVIVVILIVVYILYKKNQSKSVDLKGDGQAGGGVQLTETNPDVGKSYYDGDKPSGGGPEVAMYQDPSTIQREQAPSGDLYALPEKKQPPSSQAIGGEYAELDLTNKTAMTASTITPSTAEDPSSVVYSDVRGQ